MDFGKRMRGIRRGKGITIIEFADMISLSAGYICDIESGRRPAPPKKGLDKIILRLGVSERTRLELLDLAAISRGDVASDIKAVLATDEFLIELVRLIQIKKLATDDIIDLVKQVSEMEVRI